MPFQVRGTGSSAPRCCSRAALVLTMFAACVTTMVATLALTVGNKWHDGDAAAHVGDEGAAIAGARLEPLSAAPQGPLEEKSVAIVVLFTTSLKSPSLSPTIDSAVILRASILEADREAARSTPQTAWAAAESNSSASSSFANGTLFDGDNFAAPASPRYAWRKEFVALVTPGIDSVWLRVLEALGFQVQLMDSPVARSEVRNPRVREELLTDGAMGIREMVKIEAFRMTAYDCVCVMDADLMVHASIDAALDRVCYTTSPATLLGDDAADSGERRTRRRRGVNVAAAVDAAQHDGRSPRRRSRAAAIRDREVLDDEALAPIVAPADVSSSTSSFSNQQQHHRHRRDKGKLLGWARGGWLPELINGGFLIFNPHAEGAASAHFAIAELLREGDFRVGTGWKGSGIGWTYGGRTLQGLLPYYFFKVLKKGTHDVEFNACVYNNMGQKRDGCRAIDPSKVVVNHFTGTCLKPWWCAPSPVTFCNHFTRRWWIAWRKIKSEIWAALPATARRAASDGHSDRGADITTATRLSGVNSTPPPSNETATSAAPPPPCDPGQFQPFSLDVLYACRGSQRCSSMLRRS